MTTFGTLITRVLSDLERTDLTAVASDEIKTAVKHFRGRHLWFQEQRATLDTADTTEFYALPTDYMDHDSLVITVNDWTYPLNYRHYSTLEDWFVRSATFTGYPTDYAVYQEQLRLYPIPNGAYQMTLSYISSLTALSADGDTNEWTDEAEELIRSRACASIAARKLKDYPAAQVYKQLEQEAWTELKRTNNRRLMTGSTKRRNGVIR